MCGGASSSKPELADRGASVEHYRAGHRTALAASLPLPRGRRRRRSSRAPPIWYWLAPGSAQGQDFVGCLGPAGGRAGPSETPNQPDTDGAEFPSVAVNHFLASGGGVYSRQHEKDSCHSRSLCGSQCLFEWRWLDGRVHWGSVGVFGRDSGNVCGQRRRRGAGHSGSIRRSRSLRHRYHRRCGRCLRWHSRPRCGQP